MVKELSEQEFLQCVKQMIREQENIRNNLRKVELDLSIKSIESIRNWTFEVLTISSAILGVFIAIAGNSLMIQHKELLPYAFFCFVFTIVYGFYKLKADIENDINNIPKIVDDLCKKLTEMINAGNQFFLERSSEAYKKVQEAIGKQKETMTVKKEIMTPMLFFIFFISVLF